MAKLTCYVIDRDGRSKESCVVEEEDPMNGFVQFVVENVQKHYSLHVVNIDGKTVFRVIDQTQVFPLPPGFTANNRWNPQTKKFEEYVKLQKEE